MRKDFLKLALPTILVLTALVAGVYLYTSSNDSDKTQTQANQDVQGESDQAELYLASLIIDTSEETSSYDLEFKQGENVFQAIERLDLTYNGFDFTYDEYDFGIFITGFNGLESTNSNFWKLMINDSDSGVGVNDYILVENDNIKFVLEDLK